MKVYGAKQSSSSRRVLLTAAHLGIPYELVEVDLRVPEQRARLKLMNPNNKVPVLEDGDFRLWESHAIMLYLCDRTPGQTLFPGEPRARAEVNRWMFWTAMHLAQACGGLAFERIWRAYTIGGDADPAMVARHEQLLHQLAKVADDHLATRTWFVGDAITLADFSVASTLMYRRPAQLPLEPYRHLLDWLGRVHELEAWRATEPPGTWA